jgi:hypothetical protein
VKGNPLTTVAGVAAAASTAVGVAGVGASGAASALEGIRGGRKVEEWILDEVDKVGRKEEEAPPPQATFEPVVAPHPCCYYIVLPALLLTATAMVTGGGSPRASDQGVQLPRTPWRPKLSAAGLLGGLLAGAGIVVLLQQYAVAPLTRSLAIEGLVIGLVVGLVLPSLVRVWSVIYVNGSITRAERRLNEALAQADPPPEGGQVPPAEPQP